MLNLSATVSRLILFRKPSLYAHSKLSRLVYPFLHNSFNPISAHLSFFSKAQAINSSGIVEDLVALGIETSCEDTAAAIVRSNGEILSQVVSSRADLLARYGEVATKMAEEAHAQVIDQVVQEALDLAKLTGRSFCSCCEYWSWFKPLSTWLVERELRFPFMALLISGGHILLILARYLGHYMQLGITIDDAIGEAYAKTTKWLGLDLRKSGGPTLEELAREVPMKQHNDCNFSYAALKTRVRLAIESKNIDAGIPISSVSTEDKLARANIAASFQRVAVLHLEENCERAI